MQGREEPLKTNAEFWGEKLLMPSELRMDANSAAITFFGAWWKLYEMNHT
jgi:hypothetical protein